MEYSLTMVFLAGNGEKTSFSISNVNDTIILKNIFLTKIDALASKYGASLTDKTVTKFKV
ncbi:MAG: DUF2922 domain-containing protein [Clostridium sp.]